MIICNVSSVLKCLLFADDTSLLYSGDTPSEISSIVSNELCKLSQWFQVNKLSLNVVKTNFIVFGRKKLTCSFSIKINEVDIEKVEIVKYLGVYIDEKLTWKYHINYLERKIARNLSIIYRCKYLLPVHNLKMLYSTLILPYVFYCAEIWGNTYKSRLKKLHILQKRAMRYITKSHYLAHTDILFHDTKFLKLDEIIEYKTCLIVYKAYHNMLPVNIKSYFTINANNHNFRKTNDFKNPMVKTTEKAMCISVAGLKSWNIIDPHIKHCNRIELFQVSYKRSLLTR